MRRWLLLGCLLLAALSARPQAPPQMMKDAAEVLSRFLRIADSPWPKTGRDCWALIRPARFALQDFKAKYPGQLQEVVKELESAGVTYDRGCTTLDRYGNLTPWPAAHLAHAAAKDRVFAAQTRFAKASEAFAPAQPPAAAPTSPATEKPADEKAATPAPAAPPAEKPAEPARGEPVAPAPPTPTAPEAAGALLSKFFALAGAQPPSNQNDCLSLVRPAQESLIAFKSNHPGTLLEVVQALDRAATAYGQACRRSGHDVASGWAGATENVHQAEQYLAKETSAAVTPSAGAGQPAAGGAAVPAQSLPKAGNPVVVEQAKQLLALAQKLDSAIELALGREQIQERLIEAHASLQEFASRQESEALPLMVTSLRVAIAYYRRRLDAEDSVAMASAKESLQKAREYLQNYEKTGREKAEAQ